MADNLHKGMNGERKTCGRGVINTPSKEQPTEHIPSHAGRGTKATIQSCWHAQLTVGYRASCPRLLRPGTSPVLAGRT